MQKEQQLNTEPTITGVVVPLLPKTLVPLKADD